MRHLSIVVFAVSLAAAGVSRGLDAASRDDPSEIAAVQKLGAQVTRSKSGVVTAVDLSKRVIKSGELAHLRGLPNLLSLKVEVCELQPGALKPIEALLQLEDLDLGFSAVNVAELKTVINDADLEYLKPLANLRSLKIRDAYNLHGQGLRCLKDLQHLRTLSLERCSLTREGCKSNP